MESATGESSRVENEDRPVSWRLLLLTSFGICFVCCLSMCFFRQFWLCHIGRKKDVGEDKLRAAGRDVALDDDIVAIDVADAIVNDASTKIGVLDEPKDFDPKASCQSDHSQDLDEHGHIGDISKLHPKIAATNSKHVQKIPDHGSPKASPKGSPKASPQASPQASPKASPRASRHKSPRAEGSPRVGRLRRPSDAGGQEPEQLKQQQLEDRDGTLVPASPSAHGSPLPACVSKSPKPEGSPRVGPLSSHKHGSPHRSPRADGSPKASRRHHHSGTGAPGAVRVSEIRETVFVDSDGAVHSVHVGDLGALMPVSLDRKSPPSSPKSPTSPTASKSLKSSDISNRLGRIRRPSVDGCERPAWTLRKQQQSEDVELRPSPRQSHAGKGKRSVDTGILGGTTGISLAGFTENKLENTIRLESWGAMEQVETSWRKNWGLEKK